MAIRLRQPQWWTRWKVLALALTLVCIYARPAPAGILASDPDAIAGWDGSIWLSATSGSYVFNTAVDYAVYVTGQFNLTFRAATPAITPATFTPTSCSIALPVVRHQATYPSSNSASTWTAMNGLPTVGKPLGIGGLNKHFTLQRLAPLQRRGLTLGLWQT